MTLQIKDLQETMKNSPASPTSKRVRPQRPQPRLTLPVMTRARARQMAEAPEPDTTGGMREGSHYQNKESEEEDNYDEVADDFEDDSDPDEGDCATLRPVYKKIKHIKELHSAVKNYGINAPFYSVHLGGTCRTRASYTLRMD